MTTRLYADYAGDGFADFTIVVQQPGGVKRLTMTTIALPYLTGGAVDVIVDATLTVRPVPEPAPTYDQLLGLLGSVSLVNQVLEIVGKGESNNDEEYNEGE